MKLFQLILLLFTIQLIPSDLPAQKLGKLLKDAANDVSNALGDALADEAIERLTDRIVKNLDESIDSLFRDEYESDTSYRSKTYSDFLTDFDRSQDLPSAYDFGFNMNYQSIDDKGEVTKGVYRFNTEDKITGIEFDKSLIVFDHQNELMVTYNLEDKTGYATSDRWLKIGASMITEDMIPDYEIVKTDEYKTILNYRCQKYLGKSSDGEEFISYVTEDFPIDWQSMNPDLFGKAGSSKIHELMSELKGMGLESENKYKDGKTWYWKVTEISESNYSLDNSNFDFGQSKK